MQASNLYEFPKQLDLYEQAAKPKNFSDSIRSIRAIRSLFFNMIQTFFVKAIQWRPSQLGRRKSTWNESGPRNGFRDAQQR